MAEVPVRDVPVPGVARPTVEQEESGCPLPKSVVMACCSQRAPAESHAVEAQLFLLLSAAASCDPSP